MGIFLTNNTFKNLSTLNSINDNGDIEALSTNYSRMSKRIRNYQIECKKGIMIAKHNYRFSHQ